MTIIKAYYSDIITRASLMQKTEKIIKEPLLEIDGLSTHFKTEHSIVKAVNNISFKINKGETVGIVGESGSGKSVTALSVMNLIPQPPGKIAKGSIIFNSPTLGKIDLVKLSDKELRQIRGNEISMIFQEPMSSLNPVYTCGDQVMEAILVHQKISRIEAQKRTLHLFDQVKLPNPKAIFKAYPHQISGGQIQRVMIAMAMSCNPSLLIADEPTTALDVTVQASILELMEQLRDEHDTAIMFITHDLGVVAEVADRVIVMYRGKIVESGSVWKIFSDPQHPYTKGLLACRPRLDIKLKHLPTVSDFMGVDQKGKIVEKEQNKYKSVGEALLLNVLSEDEIHKKQQFLIKQPPILEVNNLKKHYPTRKNLFGKPVEFMKAVDDVSFNVYPGETLGLVGESGCGKTTLGRTILRLLEPTSGDIIFEGKSILGYSNRELRSLRKEIQIIFQDPYSSLNPKKTIGDIIMEPMRIHSILKNRKQRKEKALELLKKVQLESKHLNRYPHEFSGGQRQRICIARTLALQPKFIICDESVSALDVSVQAQVLNLLNELKEEFNFTYIFISHDLSVIKFVADRIIVMKEGEIVETGFPNLLFDNPEQAYTKQLIQAIPKGNLEEIRKKILKRSQNRSAPST